MENQGLAQPLGQQGVAARKFNLGVNVASTQTVDSTLAYKGYTRIGSNPLNPFEIGIVNAPPGVPSDGIEGVGALGQGVTVKIDNGVDRQGIMRMYICDFRYHAE